MFIRRKLISKKHVLKENVNCSRHYLQLSLDGYEIYVEQGLSHKYVDVLVLHSKHKSRSEAVQYVRKYIVEELISFCASSKGCPGVALVLGVIQTCCVEMLIPSDLRGAILVEELKSNYIRDINDKLEIISSESLHLVKEEELFNYEHSWHSIREHTLTKFEKARDLLWESDVEAVENKIRQKRMQQLESWEQSLIQELESLQQGLNEVNKDLIHSNPETENMVTNSNVPDVKDSNRPSSSSLSGESTSVEDCNFRLVLERIDGVGNKVDGVDERLRSVQSILQRLEMKILSLQQELQSTLSDFTSKVDRIVKYSHSLQLPSLPKRPYITDDVGVFHRMNAALNAGTTVRLHLMCESWTGFHKVKDQEGLKIRVDRYNSSWIGKTIEISYKVMYYATKAGLDVTLGLGQAIPDLADLRSNIVKLGGISDSDRRAVLKGGESMELKEAWRRIQQTLADINYSESFKLYQVKYVRQELVENKIRQKRMQQLESWEQSLIQELESLQQGLNEVNKDLIHSYPETENMVTNSNIPDVKDSNRPSSSSLSGESTSVEDRNFRTVLESIDRVGNKVDGVDESYLRFPSDLTLQTMLAFFIE
ncbi:hypothetical protein AXG93_1592s1000 [Marchantia polymorpha subsp. ruderalis]|uniref:Uncharacterized protein n=1 Tax=Marchantia polymorpha subsp. ruderalis TaxID=1480154 RepID=A0A176VT69_MARPO|nr:hypothetical protein AXG93_1592s1000 [Marchantia polymorpha subsp. ruderalis]